MADRRSTSKQLQSRSSIRSSNPNVFGDDYALDEYEPVADGRPPACDRTQSVLTPTPPPPQRSLSVQSTSEWPRGSMRRIRLSQRSHGRESTTSQFDDEGSRQSVDLAPSVSTQHRSIRTISSFGLPRAQSPYQGPTGPSQPYGMYSQDVSLARSPSVVTTSTIRPPERAYSGPGGPTQPYGMYSQNTVPDDDQEVAGMAPAMPGFPGIAQPQRQAVRRLGPDGEDADDLIGPDGYSEQLPPYSRYANGIPPKFDSGAASFINQPTHLQSQGPQDMARSATLGHQTESSEYYRPESREVIPASPVAVNPFDDTSTTSSSTTAISSLPATEKGTFRERVKRKGNKRVCCGLLPCWALAFMIVVLCAAVLLGGVVGGIVAHHTSQKHYPATHTQPQQQDAPVVTTTTTVADVSPIIATPTDLPILPTGAFNYVLNNPVAGQNSNSCLPASQSHAWGCADSANLNIGVIMQGPQKPVLTIGYAMAPNPQAPNSLTSQIRYGAQPPVLPGQVSLNLVRDKYEMSLGPAFFFLQSYNKTVILKAGDFPGSYSKLKRSVPNQPRLEERGQSEWMLNEYVNVAEKPWYCFWNGTILEGFIYVTQEEGHSSASSAAAASSYASATATATAPQRKRQAGQPTSAATYPNVIKIEERRPLKNAPQPYCQQMQIMNNGQPLPYEPQGQPVVVNLSETEPAPSLQQQLHQNEGPPPPPPPPVGYKEKRQAGANSNCMCEWLS